jgi:hypothetical protein
MFKIIEREGAGFDGGNVTELFKQLEEKIPSSAFMVSNLARTITLRSCFSNPTLDVMNLLNETMLDSPTAISFAPGRPSSSFFHVRERIAEGDTPISWSAPSQYGRTNGFIR